MRFKLFFLSKNSGSGEIFSLTRLLIVLLTQETTMSSEDELPHTSVGMVGLSDPHLSQGRRRMLDLVNRLHSTGSIISSLVFI